MTALRVRFQDLARTTGLTQLAAERDYAQSYILQAIGQHPTLAGTLAFKGGTALKKVYFDPYRFSEDLDFSGTGAPSGDQLERDLRDAVATAERAVQQHTGVTFALERFGTTEHPRGQQAFKVKVRYPWQPAPQVVVKLEVTHDEPVLLAAVPRTIAPGYGETLRAAVKTYDIAEICSEKLRATRQTLAHLESHGWAKSRGRDFYDLWHLARAAVD